MKRHIFSVLTIGVLAAVTALPALAQGRHDGGRHDGGRVDRHGWGGERDIRHFDHRHFEVWRGGAWHHGRHGGRFGWWWVVAGIWYFYPEPIYTYPDPYVPPVVVVPAPPAPIQPPPAQNWYFCEASKGYYPYVPNCPGGWTAVPATPAGTPGN